MLRAINVLGSQGWYYQQIFRLADGLQADPDMGILSALLRYYLDELRSARKLQRQV